MDGLVIFCAKYLIILPVVASAYLAWSLSAKDRRAYLTTLAVGGLLAYTLAYLGSLAYDNPRPFVSDGVEPLFSHGRDNGFPSSHMLIASVLAFTALIYSKPIGIPLVIVALVVGWARVTAGVHHGVDIWGGLLLAGLSVLTVSFFVQRRYKKAKPLPE